jgi:hypothetical protein
MCTGGIAEYHPYTIERGVRAITIITLRYDSYSPEIVAYRIHLTDPVIYPEMTHSICTLPACEGPELRA